MFMSSSGSFTRRKAWRTVSELRTAVVTSANLATLHTAHQTMPTPGDPGVDPTSEWHHAGNHDHEPSQPSFAWKKAKQLRDRVRARINSAVRRDQMHGGSQSR